MAAKNNNIEIAKFLISEGADINMTSSLSGHTSLQMAEELGNKEMVKFLTEQKLKLSTKKSFHTIFKVTAIISIIVYVIAFFMGNSVCPDIEGMDFGLKLMLASFLIPFIVIFFAHGIIKRILFLIVCIAVCIFFLANTSEMFCHDAETTYAITAIICNGVACIFAMFFPSWK